MEKQKSTETKNLTRRLLTLLGLAAAMVLPWLIVMAIFSGREHQADLAQEEMTESWGKKQLIEPPRIAVPYTSTQGDGWTFFLPDSCALRVEMTNEPREQGIYRTLLSTSSIRVVGEFAPLQPLESQAEGLVHDWSQAYIVVNVSDPVGLKSIVRIEMQDTSLELSRSQVKSRYRERTTLSAIPNLTPGMRIPFSYSYQLRGSEGIRFNPMARITHVELHADQPNPEFKGEHLPDRTIYTDSTTQAEWDILYLNRIAPQQFNVQKRPDGEITHGEYLYDQNSAITVNLISHGTNYQKADRALNYAILVIIFTFLAFFFTESFTRRIIPIVAYILTGVAILLFYTLLISLSEYITFGLAYWIPALIITAAIGLYLYGFIRHLYASAICAGILLLLFLFLYLILQLSSVPFLVASLFLLGALGLVMILTLRLDW